MKSINRRMRRFFRSDAGPTVTEYAVILALIVLGCLAAISLIGVKLSHVSAVIESNLPGATVAVSGSDGNGGFLHCEKPGSDYSEREGYVSRR